MSNEKQEAGLRKLAGETVDRLFGTIKILGVERDSDYWKATPGNAGHALNWSLQCPTGRWEVN